MCGFAGFIGPGDRNDLQAMTHALSHRGPDDEGYFVDHELRVHLGHRRLAVIDQAGGHQPMANANETILVVFNGEIYNHLELRHDLEKSGYRFRSDHSDTEVLVHGYHAWREGLLDKLDGMFAFAIFDRQRKTLLLARDRLGEKPLYYAQFGDSFLFGSEISALKSHPYFRSEIAPLAVQKLLAYGFLPAPHSLYHGVMKLPHGHYFRFKIEDKYGALRAYWRFVIEPDQSQNDRALEPILTEQCRALILRAVEKRLVSDVPLGLFLSGGLDSAAIAAAASQLRPGQSLRGFTLGFRESSFDEREPARKVAQHLNIHHHECALHFDAAENLIPDVLKLIDEPSADASLIPTYLLSRFARQYATVALSGDGSDELFAGYGPFRALAPARLYQALIPRGLHRRLRRLADFLPISNRYMSFDFRLRRALIGLSNPQASWNPAWIGPLDVESLGDLLQEEITADNLYSEAIALWQRSDHLSDIDRTLEFYTNFYLPDNILAKTDRASMMNSLEVRAPFLDRDLIEFMRCLPSRWKYWHGERKYLLKHALASWLPKPILERRKQGFAIPQAQWLRQLPAPQNHTIPGVTSDPSWIQARWFEHRCGKRDHRLFLWCWLALQSYLASTESRFQEMGIE